MTFHRYFLFVLGAAILASVIGGLFASAVALLSPDFVKGLFSPPADASLPRYAAAVGAIWGVFIGAGVMGRMGLMLAESTLRGGALLPHLKLLNRRMGSFPLPGLGPVLLAAKQI